MRSALTRERTFSPCSAEGVRYPTETVRSANAVGTTDNAATAAAKQLTPFLRKTPNLPRLNLGWKGLEANRPFGLPL